MRHRNLLLFLLLAAVWGSAFVAIKAGLGTPADPAGFFETPVLFAALRYDIAGVVMLGYAAYATDRWRPRGRTEWASVLVAGALMIAAYHAFLFVGETDPAVTSAVAAIVVSLSPVLTAGFSRLWLPSERLTPLGVAGLLLGLVGVGLLTKPTPEDLGVNLGVVLVFLAATAFALGSVLNRRIDADLPIETLEAWAMLTGAGMMHAGSAAVGESVAAASFTPTALAALAYLALAASAGGFLVYFDLLERLGPIEINLVSYVAPVFAAVTGFLLLGEVVDLYAVAGFLVILVGFGLLKRDAIRAELAGTHAPAEGD
ncbi:DMT family transporter [Halorarius halobius]|uniref:DMT family transporter n=1 Tax=Halorarius halobius TaxID=2962671 RepID=UPI0020CF6665|nr:DMT family transporter [Halorarius halobius]